MTWKRSFLVHLFLLIVVTTGYSQIVIDTSRVYYLGEIEIVATGTESLEVGTIQHISPAELERTDALSVSRMMELVPSAFVQTNSRGEQLVYLRNAGERQVALFLDGALLNIPWDNRIDLQLLPAGIIGGMTVVRGIPSVLYGPNTAGGVINLTSRVPPPETQQWEGTLQGRLPETWYGNLTFVQRGATWQFIGAAEGVRSAGIPLPSGYERYLPYNQPDTRIRTNTDFQRWNLFSRITHQGKQTQRGLTVLHVQGARGVAPEGHKNPAETRVRFWRYPDWRYTLLAFNQQGRWQKFDWKMALWGNIAHQEIIQYASVAYKEPVEREDGDDYTLGSRWVLSRALPQGRIHLAFVGLTSRHHQHEATWEQGTWTYEPLLRYHQHLLSLGTSYHSDGQRITWTLGGSLDGSLTPLTGDKPKGPSFWAPSLQLGVRYRSLSGYALRAGLGNKARFPTLRELYGEALKRFWLNPELKPENMYTLEIAALHAGSSHVVEWVIFGRRTRNTIDQENIVINGERRRRRINLRGSRTIGMELNGMVFPARHVLVEGFITWTHTRSYDEATGRFSRFIPEKPDVLSQLRLSYQPETGVQGEIALRYQGRAYALDESNTFVALPRALTIDLRLAYVLKRTHYALEWFTRINNLTDTVVLPQLGLPAAGRTWSAGMRFHL